MTTDDSQAKKKKAGQEKRVGSISSQWETFGGGEEEEENNISTTVSQHTSIPVNQQASTAGEQHSGKPVNQDDSIPAFMKGTYYITTEHDLKLERIRLARRSRGQKIDKSALIREAIDLLQE